MARLIKIIVILIIIIFLIITGFIANRSTYKNISYPSDRIIIIRMDDVQGFWLNESMINITDTILNQNISVVLGVIPFSNIDEDEIVKNYLKNKIKDQRVEIAQHGTYHYNDELLNLDEKDTYSVTELGIEKLISILGIKPVTYIPPNDAYNIYSTKVLSRLGFKIISAGKDDGYMFDGYMVHVGYDVIPRHWPGNEFDPINEDLDTCKRSLDQKHLCVVNIHPQDYVGKDEKIDSNKYRELIELLNGLEKLNARFSTFRDLQ